jgi:hypothetical protein
VSTLRGKENKIKGQARRDEEEGVRRAGGKTTEGGKRTEGGGRGRGVVVGEAQEGAFCTEGLSLSWGRCGGRREGEEGGRREERSSYW